MAVRHQQGAFLPSHRPIVRPVPLYEGFQPSLTPGGAVTHIWLDKKRSTIDVLRFDRFVLFASTPSAGIWREAISRLRLTSIGVELADVSTEAGNDNIASWAQYCAGEALAVLVRPDGRIAWVASDHEADRLQSVLDAVTGRADAQGTPAGYNSLSLTADQHDR